MSFTILGTGSYAPEHVVTNDELSALVDTNDEWITQRIGVKSRHISETETNVDLAVKAAQRALENAGVQPEELDLIIATTITGDSLSPGTGCMVQNRLGAHCPAFDIAAACSGFLFGLETAAGFLARGMYKRVLVVSAERMSGIIDWTDRSTCCIFGDGAGAAVLAPGEGLIASHLMTKGGDDVITIPTRYGNSPWYKNELPEKTSVFMNGRETYKFAVMAMSDNIKALMERAGVSGEDVALVIPHQANYRIINEARRRIPDIAPEKFCINIDRYGNTSSASVPILLDEMNRAGKIKRGDLLVLAAFGGGLSAGAMIIRFLSMEDSETEGRKNMISTPICDILGIQYPIFQGGMAWISDGKLAGAVSEAGGLGIISAMNANADYLRGQIKIARELTDKPFGVNIMLMSPFADEVAQVVAEEKVAVVTTGAGNPSKYMKQWLGAGIKVIPVVASVSMAKLMQRVGATAVIAEGGESGGHVGELTTMALVPQVVSAVTIPVIAAGGIGDGRGVAAAFMLGAVGVQLGTRFLVATECGVHQNYKNKVLKANDIATMTTGKRLGHPVRSIKNPYTKEYFRLEYSDVSDEELEAYGRGSLYRAAVEGDEKTGCFLAGQIAGMVNREQPAKEIIEEIFREAETVLNGATKWVK